MTALFIPIALNDLDEHKLGQIADIMKEGGIVIYPTDTIYAMGCSVMKPNALERMAKIKGIRVDKAVFSLIVHDFSHITDYTKPMSNKVYKIMKHSLPGPFTFILDASSSIPKLMNSRRKTVGIRIPHNPITLGIVEKLGCPMASTSLHSEDEIMKFPTDPHEIFEHYKNMVDAVIDGGYGNTEESTVIDCTGTEPIVIREGKGEI